MLKYCSVIYRAGNDYCLDCKWLRISLKPVDAGARYYDCGLGHFARDQSWFNLHDQKMRKGHTCNEFEKRKNTH